MNYSHILAISSRESYYVRIVEICAPRSKFDNETHRVQIIGGGIIRVRADQLTAA